MSSIEVLQSLSPVYRELFIKRLAMRGVLNRVTSKRCSYCSGASHTIKECCHDSAIQKLTDICVETNDNLVAQIQTGLYYYFRSITVKSIKLFACFIDCSLYHRVTKSDKATAIVEKLMLLVQQNNSATSRVQPPPPQVSTRPPQYRVTHVVVRRVNAAPRPVPAPRPAAVATPPPPPPSAPVIPSSRIHIHVNPNTDEKPTDCPVCLESYPTHTMTTLECEHKVCTECFRRMFMSYAHRHSHACPLCRKDIIVVSVGSYESYYNIANMYLP